MFSRASGSYRTGLAARSGLFLKSAAVAFESRWSASTPKGRPPVRRRGLWVYLMILLTLVRVPSEAQSLPRVQEVGRGVYAIIGDLGPQRLDNDGLNANLGFVVGADAVLVINTGPSRRIGAAVLEEIRRITLKPVRWVVDLNSQNHYWWGNSALLDARPTFVAHPEAVRLMKEQQEDQRALLLKLLNERFQGSEPWLPKRLVADRLMLDLGQQRIEILHLGAAHTPGRFDRLDTR